MWGKAKGEMLHCRLRTMTDDVLSALDYLQTNYGAETVGLVANSLSARVAIKAASEDARVSILITIVGVMDLQSTLKAVYNEDMIGSCIRGRHWDVTEVLGFHVEGAFLETAIQDQFHNLASTLADLKRIKCPIINFATENDLWVSPRDIRHVSDTCGAEFILIPGGMHQLFENRSIVKSTLRTVVEKLLLTYFNPSLRRTGVETPAFREIGFQSRIERERLRHLNINKKQEENDFWKNYLTDFDFVMHSQEFQRLFQLITQVVPLQGRKVLDVGCGNGNFGIWLFEHLHPPVQNKKSNARRAGPLTAYVGIDYVESALRQADQRLHHLRGALKRSDAREQMSCTLVLGNLNNEFPFCSDYFDVCVSNLVLSYLDDPMLAIRQLSRVLVSKGTVIVSSLKPSPDLSVIYRDFSKNAKGRELELARKLLNNAGGIRHWETEGHFRFFSADELERFLHAAGFLHVRSWPILADQGVMVAAEKV